MDFFTHLNVCLAYAIHINLNSLSVKTLLIFAEFLWKY